MRECGKPRAWWKSGKLGDNRYISGVTGDQVKMLAYGWRGTEVTNVTLSTFVPLCRIQVGKGGLG